LHFYSAVSNRIQYNYISYEAVVVKQKNDQTNSRLPDTPVVYINTKHTRNA